MRYTDDPIADFEAYDKESQDWLDSLPRCTVCGNSIEDNTHFDFDGDAVCRDCLEEYCERNFMVFR